MARINDKGIGAAVNDVVGGHVHMMLGSAGSVMTQIKTGRLRALAVTSAQPSTLLPGLPTMAASGVPGYASASAFGLFALARTPVAIIVQLQRECARILGAPEIKEKFLSPGVETVGDAPESFAAHLKTEIARIAKLIKDAGIRVE